MSRKKKEPESEDVNTERQNDAVPSLSEIAQAVTAWRHSLSTYPTSHELEKAVDRLDKAVAWIEREIDKHE